MKIHRGRSNTEDAEIQQQALKEAERTKLRFQVTSESLIRKAQQLRANNNGRG